MPCWRFRCCSEARQAGRTGEAVGLLRQALVLNPLWREGLWYLGGLYYSQDNYQGCRESLQRLVRLEPGGSAGWSMLGLCDYGAGQFDAVAKCHLAMLLTRGGDYETALELY